MHIVQLHTAMPADCKENNADLFQQHYVERAFASSRRLMWRGRTKELVVSAVVPSLREKQATGWSPQTVYWTWWEAKKSGEGETRRVGMYLHIFSFTARRGTVPSSSSLSSNSHHRHHAHSFSFSPFRCTLKYSWHVSTPEKIFFLVSVHFLYYYIETYINNVS